MIDRRRSTCGFRAALVTTLLGIVLIAGTFLALGSASLKGQSVNSPDHATALRDRSAAQPKSLDPLRLSNPFALYTFALSPANYDVYLGEILDRVSGHLIDLKERPLWKVTLRKTSDGSTLTFRAQNFPQQFSMEAEAVPGGQAALFHWSDITVDPGNTLTVTTRFELPNDSPFVRATIDVDGVLADYSIYQVWFPWIHVRKLEDSSNNVALIPGRKTAGSVVESPEDVIPYYELGYPTGYPLSLGAYYNRDNGHGFYYSCEDPLAFRKKFVVEGKSDSMFYSLKQYPEDSRTTQSYHQPFDFVFGPFVGDWYDVAQIYRAWVLQQEWVPAQKLEFRTDIRQEIRENKRFVLHIKSKTDTFTPMYGTLVDEYLNFFQVPFNWLFIQNWSGIEEDPNRGQPDYFPPKTGFLEFVQDMHNHAEEIVVQPAQGSIRYDADTPSYAAEMAELWTLKDEADLPVLRGGFVLMDPCTAYWQNKIGFTVNTKLQQEFEADAVYFDSFVLTDEWCFDSNHPHPIGGGNYSYSCIRSMLDQLIADGTAHDPNFVLTEEPPTEVFLDKFLFREGFHCSATIAHGFEDGVPLFQAVYHEYANNGVSGREGIETLESATYTPEQFDAAQSHGYIIGNRLTIKETIDDDVTGPQDFFLNHPQLATHVQFFKTLVDSYEFTRKWMFFGRMLRPLAATVTIVDPGFGTLCRGLRTMPVVESSVWEANDGTVGLVFTNWTDAQQTIGYDFDLETYGLNPATTYYLYEVDGSGRTFLQTINSNFSRLETLASKALLALEITTEAP